MTLEKGVRKKKNPQKIQEHEKVEAIPVPKKRYLRYSICK
jgi:hypothetical protein